MDITETNRLLAEQFNEAFNRGDLDAAASCFAEDCRNDGRQVERAGVRKVLAEIKTNFPDARLTSLNSVAEGEWVVVRCTYSGTHRGTSSFPVDGGMLVGVPPTGHSFEVQHMHMYRMLDSRIAEHFANRDDVGMMRQLGLIPPARLPSGGEGTLTGTKHGDAVNALLKFYQEEAEKLETSGSYFMAAVALGAALEAALLGYMLVEWGEDNGGELEIPDRIQLDNLYY